MATLFSTTEGCHLPFSGDTADVRARKYDWGMTGLISAEVLFVMPIHTQAVKLDLPAGKS